MLLAAFALFELVLGGMAPGMASAIIAGLEEAYDWDMVVVILVDAQRVKMRKY